MFLLKIQLLWNHFFLEFKMANKSKWRIYLQIFCDALIFFFTFYGIKIKPMLPSMKLQNGAQIQDGRKLVFLIIF
jgi:hypothetical protein